MEGYLLVLVKAYPKQEARSDHLKRTERKAFLRGRPKLGISDAEAISSPRRPSKAGTLSGTAVAQLAPENQPAVQWRPDEPVVRVYAARMRECLLALPATRACCADRLPPTVRDHAESSVRI